MGADLEVKLLCRGGNPYCEPKARAVTARWGLEEALGEPHGRRNTKRIRGALVRVEPESGDERLWAINAYIGGWVGYFALAETPSVLAAVASHGMAPLLQDFIKE